MPSQATPQVSAQAGWPLSGESFTYNRVGVTRSTSCDWRTCCWLEQSTALDPGGGYTGKSNSALAMPFLFATGNPVSPRTKQERGLLRFLRSIHPDCDMYLALGHPCGPTGRNADSPALHSGLQGMWRCSIRSEFSSPPTWSPRA